MALASSNRYIPDAIKQKDIESLSINAVEYSFEPGSIIKPIALSLALKHNKVKDGELFYAYNKSKKNSKGEFKQGRYKIGRFTIRDDHHFKKNYLTLDDIVAYSSNIGTLVIANRLSGEQFYNGYQQFGLTHKTKIDLPIEATGIIHKLYHYKAGEKDGLDNIYKATDSYGQGITATFMQVLKAYSVFNNDGKIVTPYLVQNNNHYKPIQIVSKRTANRMKRMLIKTVQIGTGFKTKIDGIEIGGKTGTAQIAQHGQYQKRYISSFFGFANSKDKRYTIGVSVREPIAFGKHWYYRYASESAVPIFKETIKTLIKLNYLEKDLTKRL